MLVEEFAAKHQLCDWGEEMIAPFLKETVEDWWKDEKRSIYGTGLVWLLAHAQVDRRKVNSCNCELARLLPPLFPEISGELSAAIDQVDGWANGKVGKKAIKELEQQAVVRRQEAASGTNLKIDFSKPLDQQPELAAAIAAAEATAAAWHVIEQLATSTRSPWAATDLTHTIALLFADLGVGSVEDVEKKMAAVVRSRFSWEEVKAALDADLPSLAPRAKTLDQVEAEAEEARAQFAEFLAQFEQMIAELNQAFEESGLTPEELTEFLQNRDLLGEDVFEHVQQEFARLDVDFALDLETPPATGATSTSKPKKPRRNRLSI